jgi:histidine triad (HIT) family protein
MDGCVFCGLHSGEAPARVVYRNESTFAFFPRELGVRGHTIVAPVEHVAGWPELGPAAIHVFFQAVQEVSRRLCSRLGAEAVNVLFAGGPAAQQSVAHFHVHVLPRWRDDGVDAWPKLPGYQGDIDADLGALTGGTESTVFDAPIRD